MSAWLFSELRHFGYNMVWRRWVFSSRRTAIANLVSPVVQSTPRALFSLLFPDDCRVCGEPLTEISRVPVCRPCLKAPEPFTADHFCISCRTPFQNGFPLDSEGRCALCRSGLRGFEAAYCYGSYEGVLRELIHLFKYDRIPTLAGPLCDFLAAALPRDERFDAIVPAPLHWWRRWRRGFNQSELLARALAGRTGIPLVTALRRGRATVAQAGLSHAARRRNVAGAFHAARRLDGKNILLIDDVMTTGATAAACARALKRAGAARVAALVVARADRRLDRPVAGPARTAVLLHSEAKGAL
jgi:ComF family protein